MNRFRIVPYGADEYAVQERWLWVFWWTLVSEIGYGYSQHRTFRTEADAEAQIQRILDYERRNREWYRQERARKEQIKPRRYP